MYLKISLAFFVFLLFSQTSFGQSCGGGTATFHIFDESGSTEIKDVYVALHLVSEDQMWITKDYSGLGWKRQTFDEKTSAKYKKDSSRETFEMAFEIPASEYLRLMKERKAIIEKNPQSIVAEITKDRCDNSLQGSTDIKPREFAKNSIGFCTREGCDFMVVAEIQAKGYETAYFVSEFICGCSKHYEFRLKEKPEKCLDKI